MQEGNEPVLPGMELDERSGSMNIDYLKEFVFLVESLSFRRTADHFYVSRSVISRHIAALEEAVGVRLLNRDNRGVELTEAGRVFAREAKAVLRDWDVALDRVRAVGDGGKKIVRIGYLRNAARPVLVSFVRHMAAASPDLHLSLICMEHSDLLRAIGEHAVDVAIGVNVSPRLSHNYRSTLIYEDRFSVVCAKDHPLAAKGGKVALEDLRGQKLLLPDSYVYGGLSDYIEGLVDGKTLLAAQSFYRDVDMLYLKVQTESYVAFSSGMNNAMFGDQLAVLHITDADTSFSVSAFYSDDFVGQAYRACCDGFSWCRDALKEREPFLISCSLPSSS